MIFLYLIYNFFFFFLLLIICIEGYSKEPFQYEGDNVYFRGSNITEALFNHAINYLGMKMAK
jgi:hypothetical protein